MNNLIADKKFSSGAFFAAFSAFMLMMILLLLNDSTDPFHEILSLDKAQAIPQFVSYYFLLDFLLVTGWLMGWPGMMSFLNEEKTWLQKGLCAGGLLGPLLDYAETILSIIIMLQHRGSKLSQNTLYQVWTVVSGLSYLVPYITALALGVILLRKNRATRWLAWVCILGLPLGILGYLWPLSETLTYLWWPLWFLSLGIFATRS
jgi:hypothetical protein